MPQTAPCGTSAFSSIRPGLHNGRTAGKRLADAIADRIGSRRS